MAFARRLAREEGILSGISSGAATAVAVRLAKQMPAVGDNTTGCEQAGRSLSVTLAVRPTPNPNFLRVEAHVAERESPLLTLSTVVGRY